MIEVKDLVVKYGDFTVLDGVDLHVEPNETMAILGQSGCGKSTLMKVLVGLLEPFKGEVAIDGEDVLNMTGKQRREHCQKFGVLFQSGALFNSMTILENVMFPLVEHTKLDPNIMEIQAKMKLDIVGLSGSEHRLPSELSGGMKKRAALARAMVADPKILYLDEPSAGLDPVIAAGLDELINKLKKAFRMTIVVVTHDIESTFIIADRITVLRKGKVLQVGTPDEIRDSKDEYINQFINRRPDAHIGGEGFIAELANV